MNTFIAIKFNVIYLTNITDDIPVRLNQRTHTSYA